MPRYLTAAELYARKGGRDSVAAVLAYRDEASHDADIAQAITWAESRLTSLTLPRYGHSLPSSPETTSEEIKGLVADLARMNLELTHASQAEPGVVELGGRAISHLRDVARGVAALDLPDVPADDVMPTLAIAGHEDRPSMSGALIRRLPR